jgi:hypothetical protein
MILTIVKIFSDLRKIVTALIVGLIEFVTKNPVLTGVIVLVVVSNLLTHHFTEKHTDAAVRKELAPVITHLTGEVEKANKEIIARNGKIDALEKSSKKDADDAAAIIAGKSKELDSVVTKYKAELSKSSKIVINTVTLPAESGKAPLTVNVQTEGGQVVCNRFPSTYMTTINEMIDIVNRPLILTPTPELTSPPVVGEAK